MAERVSGQSVKHALLEALTEILDKQKSLNDQALQLSEQMKARNDALEAKHESYWGEEKKP